MEKIYDVTIIGAGPAGMSAALYTSRANLSTLIIEKECPGGKMMKIKTIENYLGSSSVDAIELASNMFAQSTKYGAMYKQGNVVSISEDESYKKVVLSNGETILTKSLIIAVGGKMSETHFEYDKYLNRGLSYCVVCDANFYAGKKVALIGNDETLDDVSYLSNIVNEVYFLNKGSQVSKIKNVETIGIKDIPYEILGEDKVEAIKVGDRTISIDGTFYVDDSNSFNGFSNQIELENGYIKVDNDMHTNIDGVFACGDIINKKIKQVVSAAGDGALAALEAIKYVNRNK